MQAPVDKEIVEHKSVVLWRAKKTQVVSAFDQIRLEMFFGSMVFTPVRTERKPPGTDRVLNWAPYGLYQEQSYHLLSTAEVADKKKLDKKLADKRYRASPKGKETVSQYEASGGRKEGKRKYAYAASDLCKEGKRKYAASDVCKEKRRKYEASEGRKEGKRQAHQEAGDAVIVVARALLEAGDNGERPAVQQKTDEPQLGVLADLLGGW
jgi:hypothetical protein